MHDLKTSREIDTQGRRVTKNVYIKFPANETKVRSRDNRKPLLYIFPNSSSDGLLLNWLYTHLAFSSLGLVFTWPCIQLALCLLDLIFTWPILAWPFTHLALNSFGLVFTWPWHGIHLALYLFGSMYSSAHIPFKKVLITCR